MKDDLITAGIDIGSLSAQAVILRGSTILSYSNVIAGVNRAETADKVLDMALEEAGLSREDIEYVVGTGYGRYQVPFANKNVTEITCHARGANYFFPKVRTILDMGGQDCKAINCDENGMVKSFVMNEKCAAGTGRSVEVISKLLNVPLNDIGPLSLDIKGSPPNLSNVCVVFAKSEALQMIRSGVPVNEVLAAYCDALARRVMFLIRRIGIEEDFVISGGIAKNIGVVKRIELYLGINANICSEPQIVGAVGAALIAQNLLLKTKK
ncbi:acyl-CoA dehydratase activase [Chloroflexota bacterium]